MESIELSIPNTNVETDRIASSVASLSINPHDNIRTLREYEEDYTRPLSPSRLNSSILSPSNRRSVHHSPLASPKIELKVSPKAKTPRLEQEKKKESSIDRIELENDDDENCCLICMDSFTERRRPYPLPCTGSCTGAFVHYRCIMAWLGQSGSCPLCRGVCDPLAVQPLETLDCTNLPKVVMTPVSLDAGIIRCYVKQIHRGMFKQYGYEMYLQAPMGSVNQEDKFILAARKQIRSNMTTNYAIYTTKQCIESSRVGRMGANFLGTVFTIYDNGCDPQKLARVQDHVPNGQTFENPSSTTNLANQQVIEDKPEKIGEHQEEKHVEEKEEDEEVIAATVAALAAEEQERRRSTGHPLSASSSSSSMNLVNSPSSMIHTNVLQIREELGCITYEANRTSVGPRKMRVCIPEVDENENCSKNVVQPMSRRDRLVHRLNTGDLRNLRKFCNREPVFREDLGAYCLDFGGRVSMASVKNFQLISEDDPSMGNILQFGRVGPEMFTLDFQFPLSPIQAFAICLSSCDTKLACV